VTVEIGRILEAVSERHSRFYAAALSDLMLAEATGDRPAADDARARLEKVVTETMGIGEAVGAAAMLRSAARVLVSEGMAARADRGELVAFDASTAVPQLAAVTFDEAIAEMTSRTPRVLRDAAERSAQAIARLYGEGRVVAFAKSAELAVTNRVQELIAKALREGWSENKAGRMIVAQVDRVRTETETWTDAYARMSFRTNVNTAVTAGRFRQARDPDVAKVIPCFRFDAVGDSDCRPNHLAADGRIWSTSNPVWNQIAPPLGYNCRCQVSLVTTPMLRRAGRLRQDGSFIEDSVPAGAHPDAGFRHTGRPDLFITS